MSSSPSPSASPEGAAAPATDETQPGSRELEASVRQIVEHATFPRTAVETLLSAARATGQQVLLAKDEGAYLMTYTTAGQPDQATLTYAVGHEPPPKVGAEDPRYMKADDPWIVARVATEMVWGGDDFSEEFTVDEIAAAMWEGGVVFELVLEEVPAQVVAKHLPPSLWGRTDPIRHLVELRLVGSGDSSR